MMNFRISCKSTIFFWHIQIHICIILTQDILSSPNSLITSSPLNNSGSAASSKLKNRPKSDFSALENFFSKKRKREYTKTIRGGSGGSDGSGGNFPPLPPLPPCCVIKNGVLIFKEIGAKNGLLRTFSGYLKMCSQTSYWNNSLLLWPLSLRYHSKGICIG